MPSAIKSLVLTADAAIAALTLGVTNERGVLLTFLFHSLFESPEEAQSGVMDPQQGITVEMLRQFISYFQRHSYEFVFPADIIDGLQPRGKYVLLTFDDGYYNNVRALPVLEEFGVPAVIYISTKAVKQRKAFWWDVVYREKKKRGRSGTEIQHAIAGYKCLKTADVEAQLRKEFGAEALRSVGNLDRPLTPTELNDLSANPLISLGNHTRDHAILTNYSAAEVLEQIQGAQDDIEEMTGKIPQSIAYPNGSVSPEVVRAAESVGLRLGIDVRPGRNRLPLSAGSREMMALKRAALWSDRAIERQCWLSRSSFSFYRLLFGLRATT